MNYTFMNLTRPRHPIITIAKQNNYHKAVVQCIAQMCSRHARTHKPYLVTTRFVETLPSFYRNNDVIAQNALRSYSKLYRHICSSLISNFARPSKRDLLPKSFDFIDDSCSKSKKVQRLSASRHVHSITLVHCDQAEQFESLMIDNFKHVLAPKGSKKGELHDIESVHAEPITHNIESTIGYASKLLLNPIMRDDVILYDFNPISCK